MAERSSFADDLLAWGAVRLRDLPWRQTRDPWAVLVSEVMLQQTQVGRVVDRWWSFLGRFPDPAACAAAPLAEVLTEWQGLGYPRRARNLHRAAAMIAERGEFPDSLEGLLTLPGVGPYTARAVMAFAFERDVAVVDTNVARIFARLGGARLTAREVQSVADSAVPDRAGWVWNQSIIDLGATICRASPNCGDCPVAAHCRWSGDVATSDPAIGSSGVSTKQGRFEGSDRQARGRLMKALSAGPVAVAAVAAVMDRDEGTAARLVESLVSDGLCRRHRSEIRLPS